MDEPSGVTQVEGHRIFLLLTLYNRRYLVKSINPFGTSGLTTTIV